MVACKIFIEGGGDYRALHLDCRQGFHEFLIRAGIPAHLSVFPIACGSRKQAYKDFCKAVRNRENALLLIDSEDVVSPADNGNPWQHLAKRKGDKWAQPPHTTADDCHLMVTCMENWFLTDIDTLVDFFGEGFNLSAIPDLQDIESIPRSRIYEILAEATAGCIEKGQYHKGRHSFKLLARVDPAQVLERSAWAKRFIHELQKRADAQSEPTGTL